jgi:hypothetical protein
LGFITPVPFLLGVQGISSDHFPFSYYFLFNCFSGQQPLRLNPAEVCEVIAEVSSETYSASANHLTVSRLNNNSGKPSMDVAVSVLIKLVIDM